MCELSWSNSKRLQWLNPHNWYLMMFSPATIHVLPFDPQHGSDNARVYAGKYASKPEKVHRILFLCIIWSIRLGFYVSVVVVPLVSA